MVVAAQRHPLRDVVALDVRSMLFSASCSDAEAVRAHEFALGYRSLDAFPPRGSAGQFGDAECLVIADVVEKFEG